MSDRDELVAQFIEVSGGEESVARFYLSSSNWSLEDALSNYLSTQSEGDSNTEPPTVESDETPNTGTSRHTASSNSFGASSTQKPKMATMAEMTRRRSNEEEGQAFYAGGSERSGQQVLGPPKAKNFREQLTDMFRMAQTHGVDDPEPTPSTSTGIHWGQGMRLGMTESDHSVVTSNAGSERSSMERKPPIVLKLWSQGFSIDDGELRLYDDPQNKEFLETVMRGEVPQELMERGMMVNVDVEDHRHENYKKPTPVMTFRGSGHTLGSPVPNIEGAADTVKLPTKPAQKTTEDDVKKANDGLKLDSTLPVTTLQIRLSDGSRLAAQFNLTHTVGDIYQYISNARPQYNGTSFMLVSSFPTRELTDLGISIESAGLKNAALMQRLL